MAASRTSGGDPARTLALLWRAHEPSRRGPRPKLDVDAVVAAAIALADERGLAALSDARAGRAARRVGDGPLRLRPRQGRADRPDARRAVRGDAARAVGRAGRLARARAGGRGGQPRAVRGAPVGGVRLDRAAAARAGPDGQVRARARGVRGRRARRRGARRRALVPARVRPGRGRGGGRRGGRAGDRRGLVGVRRPAARPRDGPGALPARGARRAPRPARPTAPPTTRSTPTRSGSSGCSTASPRSSTGLELAVVRPEPEQVRTRTRRGAAVRRG